MVVRRLLGFFTSFDQRFPDKADEASFKNCLEEQLLRKGAIGTVLWILLLLASKMPIFIMEVSRADDPFMWSVADPRTQCFTIVIGLIFSAMACFAVTCLRLSSGLLQSWNWELLFILFSGFNLVALPFADELIVPSLWGRYADETWAQEEQIGAALRLVLLFSVISYTCLHMSLRSHVAWFLAVCSTAPFLVLLVVSKPFALQWSLTVPTAGLFIQFCLCFSSACREERQLRQAWMNAVRWVAHCDHSDFLPQVTPDDTKVPSYNSRSSTFDRVSGPSDEQEPLSSLSSVVPSNLQEMPSFEGHTRPSFEGHTVWESSKETRDNSDSEGSDSLRSGPLGAFNSERSGQLGAFNSERSYYTQGSQDREMHSVSLGEIPFPGQTKWGASQLDSPPSSPRSPTIKRRWGDSHNADSDTAHSMDTISNHSATGQSNRYTHGSGASSTVTPCFGHFSRGSDDRARTVKPFRWQNYSGNGPRHCCRCSKCGALVVEGKSGFTESGVSVKIGRMSSFSMLEGAKKEERLPCPGSGSPAPSSRPSFSATDEKLPFQERLSTSSSLTGSKSRSASYSGRKSKRSGSESGEEHTNSNPERPNSTHSDYCSDLSLTVSNTTISQITVVTPASISTRPHHYECKLSEAATQTETHMRTDIDTQTTATTSVEESAQTWIAWDQHRFKCKRCERPPAMPSSESGSDRSPSGQRGRVSQSLSHSRQVALRSQHEGSTGGFPRQPDPDNGSGVSEDGVMSSSDGEETARGDLLETSLQGRARSLSVTMKRWVLKPSKGACCPWHTAIDVAVDMALLLQQESRCKPSFAPLEGWQCRHCTVICTSGANKCVVCGSKRDSKRSGSGHEPGSGSM